VDDALDGFTTGDPKTKAAEDAAKKRVKDKRDSTREATDGPSRQD
jgi:hypothetical protein